MQGVDKRDGVKRKLDGVNQSIKGACLGPAQSGFDFGPALFDRIEIWGIGRQKDDTYAMLSQPFFQVGQLVGAQVVQQQHLTWLHIRNEDIIQIHIEDFLVHRSFEHEWRTYPINPQRRHQRVVRSGVARRAFDHPLARFSTAIQSGHPQVDPRLIQKSESLNLFGTQPQRKRLTQRFYPLGFALTVMDRFFFSRSASSASSRHIMLGLAFTCLSFFRPVHSSSNVISGISATAARIQSWCTFNTRSIPPFHGFASRPPVSRTRFITASTYQTLTWKFVATSCRLNLSDSIAVMTRSRKSREYAAPICLFNHRMPIRNWL